MQKFRYLSGVSTLKHNRDVCTGCKMCTKVCPHEVFAIDERKAKIIDRDGCMECGACVLNCQSGAIYVSPGVGCAAYIIDSWINGKENATCDCGCQAELFPV